MPNSKGSADRIKPARPDPEFPLTPHPSGRWCKRIRGKLHYFGRSGIKEGSKVIAFEDQEAAQEALQRYLDQRA